MKNFLYEFSHHIDGKDGTWIIEFRRGDVIGYCTYVELKRGRYDIEVPLVMTQSNMGSVITWLNEKSPLKEGDYDRCREEIKTRSLDLLRNYLGQLSKP